MEINQNLNRFLFVKYLEYLLALPQTRKNDSLIDCTIHLMQELPDTEDSLHARD